MCINVKLGTPDVVILTLVAVMMFFAVRIIIGFFK